MLWSQSSGSASAWGLSYDHVWLPLDVSRDPDRPIPFAGGDAFLKRLETTSTLKSKLAFWLQSRTLCIGGVATPSLVFCLHAQKIKQ